MKLELTYLLAFGAVSATGLDAACEAKSPEIDALSITTAKTGFGQAVTVAERHVGGKAERVEYERNKAGQWVFDVEVVKGATVTDVTVDAGSGNVLAAIVDKADSGDDNDQED